MSSTHEREVILALYQSNDWFDLYTLHEDLLLSPAQIVSVVMFLESEGLCEIVDTKAKMTEKGSRWVLKNRKNIFMQSERNWAEPAVPKGDRLLAGEPYMPNLKSVDKDFFLK